MDSLVSIKKSDVPNAVIVAVLLIRTHPPLGSLQTWAVIRGSYSVPWAWVWGVYD